MADSGKYRHSVLGGSDEVRDVYCEPCFKEGQVLLAEGYCVNCSEYLCKRCYNNHRRYKALENHVLRDKDSMPVDADTEYRTTEVCVEKCSIHTSKVIKYYCENCDKLGCIVCMKADHCQCESVKHIPDLVKRLNKREELKKFDEYMKLMAERLTENRNKITNNSAANSEMKTLAIKEIKRQREDINKFFDELEKKINKKISHIEKRNSKLLKAATRIIDTLQTEFDQVISNTEAKKNGQNCELFIAVVRAKQKMKLLDCELDKMSNDIGIQKYALLPSDQIEGLKKNTNEICRISTARLETVVDIDTGKDKGKPNINELTIVQRHFCVATDENNKSVKVVDIKSNQVTSEKRLNAYSLHGLTAVNNDQVAAIVVQSGWRKQIQFFSVSVSGIIKCLAKQIEVQQLYFKLASKGDDLLACTLTEIDILLSSGTVKSTITMDSARSDAFEHLSGIALSPDKKIVYCTDYNKHMVVSLTLEGSVKAIYKDDNMKNPSGITVDSKGYIYVCSSGTNCIHQLSADLQKVQELIEDFKGSRLSCSSAENKLYLGSDNNISVYDLT